MAPAPAAPPADATAPVTEENPAPSENTSGDPKQTALELAEKVRDISSDLVEAVRTLSGEENEMGDVVEEIWVVTSIIEEVEGAVEVAPQLNCSRQDTWFWDVRYLEAA
jgi:hypothetical protein